MTRSQMADGIDACNACAVACNVCAAFAQETSSGAR